MLKKKEIIYRDLCDGALKERFLFTQLELSKKFNFSLSTVNNALRPLEQMGAIRKKRRGFEVTDIKKLLLYWASVRTVWRDIVYTTRVELPVMKIEASVPPGSIFTAYSGYRIAYHEAPADYSEVYVYAPKKILDEMSRRFPKKEGPANLFVLEPDEFLVKSMAVSVPISQLYVDLWNMKEWYAKDFLSALERRIKI